MLYFKALKLKIFCGRTIPPNKVLSLLITNLEWFCLQLFGIIIALWFKRDLHPL